jgi:hypothetical protein
MKSNFNLSFSSALLDIGSCNSNEGLLLLTLIWIAFCLMLWLIIAKTETVNKAKDIFHQKKENLVIWSFGIFISIAVLLYMIKNIPYAVVIVGSILKIVLATFVATKADNLGRNKILWFFLGLLEHFTALIVLGITPKYISNSSLNNAELKMLNEEIQAQLSKLNGLRNSGLLNTEEYNQKIELLKQQYYVKIKPETKTQGANKVPDNKELLFQLQQAYSTGLLTEEEYQEKSTKIVN